MVFRTGRAMMPSNVLGRVPETLGCLLYTSHDTKAMSTAHKATPKGMAIAKPRPSPGSSSIAVSFLRGTTRQYRRLAQAPHSSLSRLPAGVDFDGGPPFRHFGNTGRGAGSNSIRRSRGPHAPQ